ncbi:MAG: sensor histidine kinase [Frankiales bacterium]|nr:sensor histidine kinase [Frankiales bacterium]
MTLVLIVDDDPVVLLAAANLAAVLGHDVVTAKDVTTALALLGAGGLLCDHAVLDHDLPDGTGSEVAEVLARTQPNTRVIMHTSRSLLASPYGVDHLVRKAPGLGPLMDALAAA